VIPIRLAADQRPNLAQDRIFTVDVNDAIADMDCPACDQSLTGTTVQLVIVAPAPPGKAWGTGAAVAVHQACIQNGPA